MKYIAIHEEKNGKTRSTVALLEARLEDTSAEYADRLHALEEDVATAGDRHRETQEYLAQQDTEYRLQFQSIGEFPRHFRPCSML